MTEDEILDQVERHGLGWIEQTWKYIQEDKQEYYARMMALMSLARTPMDEKGASSMRQYANRVERSIESIAPWTKKQRSRRVHPNAKLGEVVVILDAGDPVKDPLFKGAKIVRQE